MAEDDERNEITRDVVQWLAEPIHATIIGVAAAALLIGGIVLTIAQGI